MNLAETLTSTTSASLLDRAVHRHRRWSSDGIRERLFTAAFKRLVYAQTWEDPSVDLEALDVQHGSRIVTITSGGCDVMSYLTARAAHTRGRLPPHERMLWRQAQRPEQCRKFG